MVIVLVRLPTNLTKHQDNQLVNRIDSLQLTGWEAPDPDWLVSADLSPKNGSMVRQEYMADSERNRKGPEFQKPLCNNTPNDPKTPPPH